VGVSYSLTISGIEPKGTRYEAMATIYINCMKMKIDIPAEVLSYFKNEYQAYIDTENFWGNIPL